MKGASCFSGLGGAELAAPWVDWRWSADIDPHANAVREVRFPFVPNLGDLLAEDFLERATADGSLDLIAGGPPCQAFSVAGLRQSLDDPRGNLTLRWVQVIHATDAVWAVTENVPGWLSTKDNAFGCLLAGLVGADAPLVPPSERGRWTDAGVVAGPLRDAAWRILDAQYFGLAQRRRRVFVVSRRAGGGESACALLPLAESLSGNPPPRREAGEGTPGAITGRAFGGNNTGGPIDIATACNAHGGPHGRLDFGTETFIAFTSKDHGADAGDIAPTLRAMGHDVSHANGGGQVAVAFKIGAGAKARSIGVSADAEPTLGASESGSQRAPGVAVASMVRRLTPRECERLQGIPDRWTAVPFRGKPMADGPRYKLVGNSWAVPVAAWIFRRIALMERVLADLRVAA